jgi:hypothetical protein
MRYYRSTDYDKCMVAAQRTIDLIDHRHTPDIITDAVLETLIVIAADSRMQIWSKKVGLGIDTLAALYTLYDRGAGYRRVRLYGLYEVSRLERERKERREREQS